MPLINTASKLYRGSTPAVAAYMGSVKVWPPPAVNTLSATLTRIGDPWAQITTSFGGTTPTWYKFYSSTNGGGWTFRWEGSEIGPHNFDTTYSSTFVMKVESFEGSNGLQTATTNTVTMGPRPLVPVQREVYLNATAAASYNGSNQKRTDADGVNNCYYGYYSSNQGQQKSLVNFAIPAEIRNCVSVDRVAMTWYNNHHFYNSGGKVSMVGHHGTSLPSTFPGSTGVLLYNGGQVKWPAPKPGWINGAPGGNTWYDLHYLTSSGRYSIAEEIRIHNLQGFGLTAAESGQAGYGYAATNPQLYILYTVMA